MIRLAAVLLIVGLSPGARADVPADRPSAGSPVDAPGEETVARGDAYWHLARAFYVARRHHRADEAIRDIRTALELEPRSAELKAEAAGLLVLLGRRGDAERIAREALAIDPEQPRALRTLAEIQVGKALSASDRTAAESGLNEAIDLFGRLTAGDDPEPDDLLLLARLQNDVGRYDDAATTAERLCGLQPGDWEAADIRFRSLLAAGRGVEAVEGLVEFLVANPGSIGGLDLDGFASDLVRRAVEEEDAWPVVARRGAEMVEAHPDVPAIHALYGEALLREGRNVEAIAELEEAVARADGPSLQLQFYLAAAYASTGRLADAVELSSRLLERTPGNAGVLGLLGEAYSLRGQVDEAVATFEEAIESIGTDPGASERRDDLRMRIGALLAAAGREDEAAAALEGLEGEPTVETLELSTRIALPRGDDKTVRRNLRKLRDGRSKEAAAVADALEGELLAREGRIDRAREHVRAASEVLGPGVLARTAGVLREIGQPEEGERLLREWVERAPDSARAHFRLGAYLERSGKFDDALARLERAIELDDSDPEVLNYLGYSLADRDRDLERALALVERALEADPWNGAYLDSLGWVYYRLGRYREAREPLERAAREYPNDVTVLDHLGDLYVRLEEPDRAVAVWESALSHADGEDADRLRSKISAITDHAELTAEPD